MPPAITLPVGGHPGWENGKSEDEGTEDSAPPLRSVAESSVILQSLRQSRDAWLTSVLPKFSTKYKGKQSVEISQPPHTIKQIAKCDVEIGPHTFPNTTFFEVQYHSKGPQYEARAGSYYYPSLSTGPWSAQTPYGTAPYASYGSQPRPSLPTPAVTQPPASAPLITALESSVDVTPALIAQVNTAAASNPTLQNLLQIAASGRASTDQLKTLGILIQSLAAQPNTEVPPVSSDALTKPQPIPASMIDPLLRQPSSVSSYNPKSSDAAYASAPKASSSASSSYVAYPYSPPGGPAYQPPQPVKTPDLVIEFVENPSDRWLLPRESLVCERLSTPGAVIGTCHIVLSAFISRNVTKDLTAPSQSTSSVDVDGKDGAACPVTFRLVRASPYLWETVSKWSGDHAQTPEARELFKKRISEGNPRDYLQHQLPEGALLTQLKSAATPYTMRYIKSLPSTEGSKVKRPPRPRKSAAAAADAGTTPTKRRKPPVQNIILPKIACVVCGQTDVPLLHGGRFCRPCTDAGKAIAGVPQKVHLPAMVHGHPKNKPPNTASPPSVRQVTHAPLFVHSPLGVTPSKVPTPPAPIPNPIANPP